MSVNSLATPPRERAGNRFADAPARLLQRDLFGVRAGVLLMIFPVFLITMYLQVEGRGMWNHPPDSRYYLTMMWRDMGHSLPDSVARERQMSPAWHLSPWYFASNDPTWQMVRTRMLYPVLSIPFVWAFGMNYGCLAVPILADVVFFWLVARTLQRLYGPAVSVIVTGAFTFTTPIMAFSWAGTDTLAMALAAVMVVNLPIERRIGKANLAWLGMATVFIALSRQVGVLAPAMAGAGWLWCLIRERAWRNRWLSSLVVTSVGMVGAQLAMMSIASADTSGVLARGQSTMWGVFRQFVHFLKIVTQEAMTFMWNSDHTLLVLLIAAGLGMLVRIKSDAAAVFVGGVAATYVITAGVGFSSYMRYEMMLFPAAAVATGAFVSMLLGDSLGHATVLGEEPATEPRPMVPRALVARYLPALGRSRTDEERRERWIPQAAGGLALLAIVVGVSFAGSFGSSAATPANPSLLAAQGEENYAMKPLAKPPAEVTVKAALVQAANVAKGYGMLEGPFDWTHALRYRPVAPNNPEWGRRAADGTTVTQISAMDVPLSRAFGNALTFNRTVLPDTIRILSRQTNEYGEDVTFTVMDTAGVEHRGTATTLYPIWGSKDPGLVTSLVYGAAPWPSGPTRSSPLPAAASRRPRAAASRGPVSGLRPAPTMTIDDPSDSAYRPFGAADRVFALVNGQFRAPRHRCRPRRIPSVVRQRSTPGNAEAQP